MAKFEEYNQVAKFERPQKTCQKLEAKKDFVTNTFCVGMGVGVNKPFFVMYPSGNLDISSFSIGPLTSLVRTLHSAYS